MSCVAYDLRTGMFGRIPCSLTVHSTDACQNLQRLLALGMQQVWRFRACVSINYHSCFTRLGLIPVAHIGDTKLRYFSLKELIIFFISFMSGNNSHCQAVRRAHFLAPATAPFLPIPPPNKTPYYTVFLRFASKSATLSFMLLS